MNKKHISENSKQKYASSGTPLSNCTNEANALSFDVVSINEYMKKVGKMKEN